MTIGFSAKNILDRRPNIVFVAPRSGLTIPEPERNTAALTPKEERVSQLIQSLKNTAATADAIEVLVAERAKNEVLKLNLSNPEDAVVAQAAARIFPQQAINKNGFIHVPEITFDMYNKCIQDMKEAGKVAGTKQQTKQTGPLRADKTDFGGGTSDRRPDINQTNVPFAPIDLPAFIAAGIPILFNMLFPLINGAIKKDVVGHTHPIVTPTDPVPVPSGPGIPVSPV
jgi:hypothetical protein